MAVGPIGRVGDLDGRPQIGDPQSIHVKHRLLLPHELSLVHVGDGPADSHVHHPLEQRDGTGYAGCLQGVVRREVGIAVIHRPERGLSLEPGAGEIVLEAELLMHGLAALDEVLSLHGLRRSRRYSRSRPVATRSWARVSRSRTVTV
jgi:hypothetical protein